MYTANGEASDWMLGERGIFAISPELGIVGNPAADPFFVMDHEALKEILLKNYPWIKLIFEWFI